MITFQQKLSQLRSFINDIQLSAVFTLVRSKVCVYSGAQQSAVFTLVRNRLLEKQLLWHLSQS